MNTGDEKKTDPAQDAKETDAVADELGAEMSERDNERRESERDEQEDLNQGMSTGTYDSTRSGVNWPASYRVPMRPAKPEKEPDDSKK